MMIKKYLWSSLLVGTCFLASCGNDKPANTTTETSEETTSTTENQTQNTEKNMRHDVHSYARPQEAVVTHLDLDIAVNFESKTLSGTASYKIQNKTKTNKIYLDVHGLSITKVMLGEKETTFELGENKPFMGQPLIVDIEPTTDYLTIHYKSSPDAEALQWLNPQQTAGKEHPFLFTQSQAILARTWIPCQDSPGIRMTYSAKVSVPSQLMAVMSASNPVEKNETGKYEFEMKQPIPSYLMALSVGDIVFKSVGANTGVYAEPSVLDKAVYEFGEMQKMLESAEALYGKYRWEQYDLIVLPPSFPFGGMENPRLTFATPTILAGDRSLTALVAHELAHSWSGNLVTNATWNDFWLNEGFTVYFENRIMEAVAGKDYADMLAIISYQDLVATVEGMKDTPETTKLKLSMEGENPDDGVTSIAYDKGFYFLKLTEEVVGREAFDAFLNEYFSKFAFQTITTEEFLDYYRTNLLDKVKGAEGKIQVKKWIYEAGIPDNCPKITSERYDAAFAAAEAYKSGSKKASELNTKGWAYQQWVFFLGALPESMTQEQMSELDAAFGFTKSGNSEILGKWFVHVGRNEYQAAYPAMETFLINIGRRKFLQPIYQTLAQKESTLAWAKQVYVKAKPNYHAVSFNTIDGILGVK